MKTPAALGLPTVTEQDLELVMSGRLSPAGAREFARRMNRTAETQRALNVPTQQQSTSGGQRSALASPAAQSLAERRAALEASYSALNARA